MALRSSTDDGTWVIGLFFLALWAAAAVGWIWNIVKIVGSIAEPITAMFVLRCVGALLMPIGAILGYF